jgi:polyisoprenoid-binding protein YceI
MMSTNWKFDTAHSNVTFSVRHMVVSRTRGKFAKWSGELLFDPDDVTKSKVEVSIDPASIDTNEPQRDEHLRSADFLDVKKHPHLTFRSRKVQDLGENRLRVIGDLTIAGVAREVVLEVENQGRAKDPWGGERAGFSARTHIDRGDFGLTYNKALEAGGFLVGTRVDIEIEIEAVRQPAVQAA